MTLEIRVDAEAVTKALDELDGPKSKTVLKNAVRKAGNFLKPKVKAEAPKGATGKLRREVKVKVKQSKERDGFYAAVRSFAPHHHLVVKGTGDRFTRGGAFRGQMPANAYVDRAANLYEDAAIRAAEQELAAQLDLE